MLITKRSSFTGVEHTLDIPVTEEQLNRWKLGEKIQSVMGNLTPMQREFLMTGATEDEWNAIFPDEDD